MMKPIHLSQYNLVYSIKGLAAHENLLIISRPSAAARNAAFGSVYDSF